MRLCVVVLLFSFGTFSHAFDCTRMIDWIKQNDYVKILPDSLAQNITCEGVMDYYLRTSSVEVIDHNGDREMIPLVSARDLPQRQQSSSSKSVGPPIPSIIWQIGKAIWTIVKDNRPSTNVTDDWAGAVPSGVKDWRNLYGWRNYRSELFHLKFHGTFGSPAEYKYIYQMKYHGRYKGVGAYITELTSVTQSVTAHLGEHVFVHVKADNPVNYGTPKHPIGGLDMTVTMIANGVFGSKQIACTYTFMGNGTTQKDACAAVNYWV
eukprot:TRINITY_DN48501_c0_g1_i1.p1 TRINITY_DN48501_c0_g1~~TRINITY_DN48501_c0_g1_i1.p1  ORF type:complete len:274 (+),score=22.53 TRINITY_DN48501_c0_g1_i1:32-823(+)